MNKSIIGTIEALRMKFWKCFDSREKLRGVRNINRYMYWDNQTIKLKTRIGKLKLKFYKVEIL